MTAALQKYGASNLAGAAESLGGRYNYGQLRLCRALFRRR